MVQLRFGPRLDKATLSHLTEPILEGCSVVQRKYPRVRKWDGSWRMIVNYSELEQCLPPTLPHPILIFNETVELEVVAHAFNPQYSGGKGKTVSVSSRSA